MDFLREFDGDLWVTFWELLAVTGSLLGVLGVVHGASRSGQILCLRPSGHPSASILEQRSGTVTEETRKMTSKKVFPRSSVHRECQTWVQDQITVWLEQLFANELLWWSAR